MLDRSRDDPGARGYVVALPVVPIRPIRAAPISKWTDGPPLGRLDVSTSFRMMWGLSRKGEHLPTRTWAWRLRYGNPRGLDAARRDVWEVSRDDRGRVMGICYYEGDRIYLRPVEPGDEPVLRAWFNDPANWRSLERFLPINEPGERRFIDGLYKSPSDVVFAIMVREGDAFIGVMGLHGIDVASRRASLGILIGSVEAKGQGYGTEAVRLLVRYAFEELNLNRVGLCVMDDNPGGIRAYEKAGFVREGRARQAHWRNGRWHDGLHFGILREDYEAETSADGAAS